MGQTIIHVKHDATGTQNGTIWPTAWRTVEAALNQAAGLGYVQIWVAEGTYRPLVRDQGMARTESFRIPPVDGMNLALYGGFAGTEAAIPIDETHDPRTPGHVTALSGDLNGDDAGPPDEIPLGNDPTRDDNAFHVLSVKDLVGMLVIDGFTITGGHGDGQEIDRNDRGGGMEIVVADPTIRNCLFTRNYADREGGAVNNRTASQSHVDPRITAFEDCQFTFNATELHGGAVFLQYWGHASFTRCVFEFNQCIGLGGAMCSFPSAVPRLRFCEFRNNTATGAFQQPALGGALYVLSAVPLPTQDPAQYETGVVDTLFKNNTADKGGAVYVNASEVDFVNVQFISNDARFGASDRNGGALHVNHEVSFNYPPQNVNLINCLFLANTAGGDGGALYIDGAPGLDANCANNAWCTTLTHCTFGENNAIGKSGGIYRNANPVRVRNSILWANSDGDAGTDATAEQFFVNGSATVEVRNSSVQDANPSDSSVPFDPSNIDDDPIFADPVGSDAQLATGDENLRPDTSPIVSPCIDRGENNYWPLDEWDMDGDTLTEEPLPLDLDRKARGFNAFGIGGSDFLDMGAYEVACQPDSSDCPTGQDCGDATCDGFTGTCVFLCSDGVECTGDACVNIGGGESECQHFADDDFCDDGDICTTDMCDPLLDCINTEMDCDDENPCTTDDCDDGDCVNTPNTAFCDDGDNCTQDDICSGGICAGIPVVCNDADACTSDSCNPASGACVYTPMVCNDGNVCTDDNCVSGSCVFTNNTAACDDADPCTLGDVCSGGVCGGTPMNCDDGSPCTDDGCVDGSCVHTPNTSPCDDDDACTENDVCAGGVCGGTAVDCDDLNECTDDSCDPQSGCQSIDNGCDDGIDCTIDYCDGYGACLNPPNPAACDDADPCTDDACDPETGCTHVNNVLPCDDGKDCTWPDACADGVCEAPPILYGDVNHDNVIDVFDILCVLDGFAGVFVVCAFEDVDIAHCRTERFGFGDGVMDIFDILYMLDAFGGGNVRCCTSEEMMTLEEFDPPPVLLPVDVTLVPSATHVQPGQTVEINVRLGRVSTIRGYQVAVEAAGGAAGTLTLEDVFVDDQAGDYLFAGHNATWGGDVSQSRLANVLNSGSVTTTTGKYACTFVFRASGDASGTFTISLQTDERTVLVAADDQLFDLDTITNTQVTVP